MTVTRITELNKKKSKIDIDGEFAFVLYKGEIRAYGIAEGNKITEDTYQMIIQQVLSKRAKLRSMNLLKSRDYTTAQLRKKLKEGFYPSEIIDEAIDYVTAFHYLDDERYARDYIRYHIQDRSRKRIEMDLLQRGIDKQQIERLYGEITAEDKEDREEVLIADFLMKKYSVGEMDDTQRNKAIAALYRKGFSLDKIYKVLKKFDV